MKNFKTIFFIFICFLSLPSIAEQIKSKEQLIEFLEKDGIKPGTTIWLKRPLKVYETQVTRIPGLTMLKFIDADVLSKIASLPNSPKQLVIFTKDEKENEIKLVLKDNDIYDYFELPLYSDARINLYTKDPSKKTKKWGKKVLNAISQESFFIGMTEEQVITSTGSPDRINESAGEWGSQEQWIYGEPPYASYLYFRNGILKSVQNVKKDY